MTTPGADNPPFNPTSNDALDAAADVVSDVVGGVGGSAPVPASTPSETPAAPVLRQVADLGVLAEVQVELSVELGRVRVPLRDLLSLSAGQVLELERTTDAPVDILVNGRLVGRGEVVVVDGEFGVRVTEITRD